MSLQSFRSHRSVSHFARLLLALVLTTPTLLRAADAVTGSTQPKPAKTAPTTPAAASSTSSPAKVVQMPVIVVTAATRTPQSPETTATSATVITHDELAAQQYASVADALTKVPGLAVTPYGAPGQPTSVFLRGTDSNQTLFTLDGRHQPQGLSGAYDFGNLTLDNVDQIEIVRTPSSSLQGGNATGGVINLVTLSGRGLDHPESSVSFEGGSFDTYRENVQSRGAEGAFDYAVSASRLDADMDRTNENYRDSAYRGNFGYQLAKNVYLDLHTGYSLADVGAPNSVYTPDPVARVTTEDWFISPEITANVTDFYTTKLYYNRDQQRQAAHDHYTNFDYYIFPSSTRLQIDTDSVDWQNNFQIARNWQVVAGVQSDNSRVYQFDDLVGARTLGNSLFNIGGYLESQWEALPGLNVLSSIRYDHYSDFAGALSWRQGVAYTVKPTGTILHASGSSSYTPPSLQDLYYPGYSNPDLKPEESLGWEVGVEQPLLDKRLTPSVTYFHNSITHYIQDDANYIPQNIGRATTEGVEIDLQAKPIDQLTLDLNYTYLSAENDSESARLTRRPRNSLNFTAVWTPLRPLTLSLGGSWVVGRQDYSYVTYTTGAAPDYFVLRASATWKINPHVSIWVRGENLGDAHYQPVLGYPALGAAGYGGIKVSF